MVAEVQKVVEFCDEFRFLHNFYPAPVLLPKSDGFTYPSVEHAYQACKTDNMIERAVIRSFGNPGDAKRHTRTFALPTNWDNVKVEIMENLVLQKFSVDPLKKNLLTTGDTILINGNHWGEMFWGIDLPTMKGANILGTILMNIRASLSGRSVTVQSEQRERPQRPPYRELRVERE